LPNDGNLVELYRLGPKIWVPRKKTWAQQQFKKFSGAPKFLGPVRITSPNLSKWRAARKDKNLVTTFGGNPHPKIWEGKKRPEFGAISDNFGL